jgi:hypothetical protein
VKAILGAALAAACLCAPASAKDATIHGRDLQRVGDTIHSRNFDVTLDGRLLTADEAVYHSDTGVVELKGKVRLHFGKNLRTFPGEVR